MKNEDLYSAIGGVDDALLAEFEADVPKKHFWPRVGAIAACAALLTGGLLLWRPWETGDGPNGVSDIYMEASATTTEGNAEPEPSAPTPIEQLPELTYGTRGADFCADIGYPKGYFVRSLSAEQLAAIWGEAELCWEGVYPEEENSVSGEVVYDGEGKPWVVRIDLEAPFAALHMELSPERLPPTCLAHEIDATCEVYGTPVEAYDDGNRAGVTFLRGEGTDAVGVRLELSGEPEKLKELTTRLVSQSLRPDGVLQLHQLDTDEIPAWRSEALSEEAAYADESFGAYLPTGLPFAFESAYREMGEGRDWMNASWTSGVQRLSLTVERPEEVRALVHTDQPERYDRNYYGGDKPDVPEEYYESWAEPVFYREELTQEVIETRLWQGDFEDCVGANFGVLYPDGTVLYVNVYAQPERLPELLRFLLPE